MSGSTIFAGSSRYSADFQSVIDRSVAIASLPLQQLQSQKTDLQAQSSALSGIDSKFLALQNAIEALNGAVGPTSYLAESSDAAAARASVTTGALAGFFTLDVISLGSRTSTISSGTLPAVADPYTESVSASGTYTLTVNGATFTIEPGGGSLVELANAINDSAAAVEATIVNTGNSDSPNYRLAIRGSKLNADSIQLNDGTADLLDTLATGANATYQINGLQTTISSDSRTVVLAPGVTADLLQTTPQGQPVTITVSRDTEALQSSVSSFVDAYNAAVEELDGQRGENAGILSGQSILSSLAGALRQMTQYRDPVSGANVSRFGIELDSVGRLSFNSSKFSSASSVTVLEFLGSDSAGFLKAAQDAISLVEDPDSGLIKTAIQSTAKEIERQDDLIERAQEKVNSIRTSLQERMAAADAVIASMEQQVTFMTGLFKSMQTNSSDQ